MYRPLTRAIERRILAGVSRPGRFDAPLPGREDRGVDPVRFVLGAPCGSVALPRSRPLGSAEFRFPSFAPVADGSGDEVTGVIVRPAGEPGVGVVLLPGWLGSVRSYFPWLARRLARRSGLVAVADLPAHFGRTPPGAEHGVRFFCGDPVLTRAYLRQTLSDARTLVRSLRREIPGRPLVVCGFSLGAWAAGMTATLEDDAFAVLATPAVDLGDVLRNSPLLEEVRRALWRSGHDPEEIIRQAGSLSLLVRPAPVAGALLLAGSYDEVIDGMSVVRLGSAWRAAVEFFPVGHMTPYVSGGFVRRLIRAVERISEEGRP